MKAISCGLTWTLEHSAARQSSGFFFFILVWFTVNKVTKKRCLLLSFYVVVLKGKRSVWSSCNSMSKFYTLKHGGKKTNYLCVYINLPLNSAPWRGAAFCKWGKIFQFKLYGIDSQISVLLKNNPKMTQTWKM